MVSRTSHMNLPKFTEQERMGDYFHEIWTLLENYPGYHLMTAAERTAYGTPYPGMMVTLTDDNKRRFTYYWDGTEWLPLPGTEPVTVVSSSGNMTVPGGVYVWQNAPFGTGNTKITDDWNCWNTATLRWTCPLTGIYALSARLTISNNAAPGVIGIGMFDYTINDWLMPGQSGCNQDPDNYSVQFTDKITGINKGNSVGLKMMHAHVLSQIFLGSYLWGSFSWKYLTKT